MELELSMTDTKKETRTFDEIVREAKLKVVRNKHYKILQTIPMLPIKLCDVVMYLCISDQLIQQLIKDIHTQHTAK